MCLSTQNILLGFTRRLTKSEKKPLTESENFNSQPHKEADHARPEGENKALISTHSLTRRLTKIKLFFCQS